MSERFFPFDSVKGENGVGDRVYKSADFVEYHKNLMTTGIVHDNGKTGFDVKNIDGLKITIGEGSAFINGRHYVMTTPKTFTLPQPSKYRVDLIILRCDTRLSSRSIKLLYVTGVESEIATEVRTPNISRTEEIYDLGIYAISHGLNATTILENKLVDYRGNNFVCPLSNPKGFGGATIFSGKNEPNPKVLKAGDIWMDELT